MGRRSRTLEMPLTPFQREVLALIVANRSEESHFAGGLVLNAKRASARFSKDFDIFHDAQQALVTSSTRDIEAIRSAGLDIELVRGWDSGATSFRQAIIRNKQAAVSIDWALDAAIRFFPIEPDKLLGWRLHLFDIATNKALALSGRSVTRDYIDIVNLDATYPLEATCWAACGKDPGFTPLELLAWIRRFAKISPQEIREIKATEIDPIELKRQWLEISDRAEKALEELANREPDLPIGVAFLDDQGSPTWPLPGAPIRIHSPTVGGCWPKLSG